MQAVTTIGLDIAKSVFPARSPSSAMPSSHGTKYRPWRGGTPRLACRATEIAPYSR